MTITQEMRGRPVTAEEARQACRRLINSHFHNPDSARVSIPCNPMDDDVLLGDYLLEVEKALLEARFRPLGDNHHNANLCPYCQKELRK